MFPFALFDPQSIIIAGFALIIGTQLLRKFHDMRKSLQKPMIREYPRDLYATSASECIPQSLVQSEINQNNFQTTRNVCEEDTVTSWQRTHEQLDVELLTLSRQIKAEIDTKVVALQLMIADADRALQQLKGYLPQSHQIAIPTPYSSDPDRMRIIKQEEASPVVDISQNVSSLEVTATTARTTPHSTLETPSTPHDPADLNNLVVDDPFATNDFGFDKAMRDLDQLSSSIPAFDAMRSLDSWDTPKCESSALLPEWDTPLSYPISGYRTVQENPTPQVHDTPAHHVASRTSHRKKNYTNKLLTQAPPRLDSLMTDEIVGKMGSKPHRGIGQTLPDDDNTLVPPMIPKIPPPDAEALFIESVPLLQTEVGLENISVRKGRRYQLQYLIEKGMSPKDIAAHLEMPVGEVELIFSLHKRLSGETTNTVQQPLADDATASEPVASPRVIAAELVAMPEKATGKTTSAKRRFRVIKHDDGEQVAG